MTLNGHRGLPIPVLSGVRQGDPMSCPLFVAVIESLATYITQNERIPGVRSNVVKTTMYADDTTIIVSSPDKAKEVIKTLTLYGRASGAKVNWNKTMLLLVGSIPKFSITGVQSVDEEHPYKHLGIPVGVKLESALRDHWSCMVQKVRKIADIWSRFHLSMKGRVLIANSLIMSLPRYAMRFLPMPTRVREDIQKEYYRLIWDMKPRKVLRDLHACHPASEGGVGAFDLKSISTGSVIDMVARSMQFPQLPWVELAKEQAQLILQKR